MAAPWRRSRPGDEGPPDAPPEPEPAPPPRLDLWLCAAATVLAACAAAFLPDADLARLVLTAPAWLFLPGYLLLQAALVPVRPAGLRAAHAAAAVGLSPAVVGLLALATLLLPGGLGAGTVVATVTFACLALAVVAGVRRAARPVPDDGLERAPPAAEARPGQALAGGPGEPAPSPGGASKA